MFQKFIDKAIDILEKAHIVIVEYEDVEDGADTVQNTVEEHAA